MSQEKILYLSENSELCYPLDYYRDMLDEKCNEIILREESVDKNADRYCTMHDFFTSEGDCGFKNCRDYEPKNGVKGMCVHKTFSYMETGRKFRLTKDDFVEIKNGIVRNS